MKKQKFIYTIEWRMKKRIELLAKYDFDGIQKLWDETLIQCYGEDDYSGKPRCVKDEYAYHLLSVIIDIEHWDYYDDFKKAYPKITFGAVRPFYLPHDEERRKPEKAEMPIDEEEKEEHYVQLKLF